MLLALGVHLPLPEVASEYATYMAATYGVMMIVALSRSIFPAFGGGMVVLVVIVAAVPLNLVGDLVLMHGLLGIPAMGLAGAGAASLLVAVFMASLLLAYMGIAPRLRGMGIGRALFAKSRGFVAPALARAGLFTGATALCETGVYLSSTAHRGVRGDRGDPVAYPCIPHRRRHLCDRHRLRPGRHDPHRAAPGDGPTEMPNGDCGGRRCWARLSSPPPSSA